MILIQSSTKFKLKIGEKERGWTAKLEIECADRRAIVARVACSSPPPETGGSVGKLPKVAEHSIFYRFTNQRLFNNIDTLFNKVQIKNWAKKDD